MYRYSTSLSFAAVLLLAAGTNTSLAADAVVRDAIPPAVEVRELAPVMATDGSGLPFELWRGLNTDKLEALISQLEIPPRSPALHSLWKRLITADVTPPSGAASDIRFTALRLESLYRSGLANDKAAGVGDLSAASDPTLAMLAARNALASGDSPKACTTVQKATSVKSQMPKRLKGQAVLMTGYCAAVAGDAAAAGLAAELAREEGQEPSPGLQALDAISIGAKPKITAPAQLSLLDYRIVERIGRLPPAEILEKGEPALLVALSSDPATPIDLGLPAAEKAAALNALAPEMLAAIYRANASPQPVGDLLAGGKAQGPLRRASLLKAAETERAPKLKAQLIRALLDDAKTAGLRFQILSMVGPMAASLTPSPEISFFAEAAIEAALVAGKYESARRWVTSGNGAGGGVTLEHWLALVDIADVNAPTRGEHLAKLEPVARAGQFSAANLHRLATVLDALNYNVPIPLWEIASQTPQPNTGYLPETGVLSELQDAAQKKEFGRTVLLAMKSLGPNGAAGAHMIALGDSIRALKRAGLESEARRLGFEALFEAWPRARSSAR